MPLTEYIQIRKSMINLYQEFPLYCQANATNFVLYKPAGTPLDQILDKGEHHPVLFIHQDNRIDALQKIQGQFNNKLKQNLGGGEVTEIKSTLCNLVGETLEEPRSGALNALPETIDIMMHGVSGNPDVLKALASVAFTDYTTIMHSVNVMALTMGYCYFHGYNQADIRRLSLSALLHDVGKTEIPPEILKATRKLSGQEFAVMRTHTSIGADIILTNNGIEKDVAFGALEHHEKLDGSGYPNKKTEISDDGQLLSIIDCYEALTNEDRLYRRAKSPFDTLGLLKSDLLAGKFNRHFFQKFCTSLL